MWPESCCAKACRGVPHWNNLLMRGKEGAVPSCSGLFRAALRKGVLEAPHWNNLLIRGKEGAAELLWAAPGCSAQRRA